VFGFPLFFLDFWLEPLFLLLLVESLAGPAACGALAFGALLDCRWVLLVALSVCVFDEALDF
jgi:hypothetical protein